MYGLAWKAEPLTEKRGMLEFCWDGLKAWTKSQTGDCDVHNGLTIYWDWRVKDCQLLATDPGPAFKTFRTGRGSYWCDGPTLSPCSASDPNGYHHTLTDREDGFADGSSTCTFSYTGKIVLVVGSEVVQGCT